MLDLQFIIKESDKIGSLYKVTLQVGDLYDVRYEEGVYLKAILGGYVDLLEHFSLLDELEEHLQIKANLEAMKPYDPTIQELLDNNVIKEVSQPFKLYFPNGIN